MIPNIEHFPYVGLFLLLLLGGIGLPIPEDATLILCGFLISTQVVKPIPALITVYVGLLIADLTLHFIGKKYGRQVVTHRRFHKLISAETALFSGRKIQPLGNPDYRLGKTCGRIEGPDISGFRDYEMPALKFLVTDAVSSLFTMTLMIGAGYWGGNSIKFIKQGIVKIEHIAILVVILFILLYSVYRYLKPRLSVKK